MTTIALFIGSLGLCLETIESKTIAQRDDRGELGRPVASVSTLAGASYSLLVCH